MGLFSKKDPCAICGGKVSGLFPWKIDGQYVCNDCHGVTDLPDDMENHFTMEEFRQYRTFREQNQALKNQFSIDAMIDLGLFDTKIAFDYGNCLFCFDKKLNKTIFRGSELKSFVIREDTSLLYEGSAQGLVRHPSSIPERIQAMAPQIAQYRMEREMRETLERLSDRDDNRPQQPKRYIDVPEPFKAFNIELYLNHPYWGMIKCDLDAPTFDNDRPDINDYLREYRSCIEQVESLVQALMRVAFPGAPQRDAAAAAAVIPAAASPAASAADPSAELRKFKALMDDGIITAAEFEAKKKQLLNL